VAVAAGVARPAVFATSGSKPALPREAIDQAPPARQYHARCTSPSLTLGVRPRENPLPTTTAGTYRLS
jgi:hypothetical protein